MSLSKMSQHMNKFQFKKHSYLMNKNHILLTNRLNVNIAIHVSLVLTRNNNPLTGRKYELMNDISG